MNQQSSSKKQKNDAGEGVNARPLEDICPSCKTLKVLSKSLSRSHIAAAVCAHKSLVAQFVDAKIGLKDDNCSFKVCSNCASSAREAVNVVRGQLPSIPVFNKQSRTVPNSVFIDTPFDVEVGDIHDLVINVLFLISYHHKHVIIYH